ncbi:MAG: hypothetical protein A2046_11670 [Bacteroidetes bacterium GWA2_30_7]|nr:MAG: hypothetical protein A2046_11670 [Bacteroidetes bacterium GWA2_30_7]
MNFIDSNLISNKYVINIYFIINIIMCILVYIFSTKKSNKLTQESLKNQTEYITQSNSDNEDPKLLSLNNEISIKNQLYNKLKGISESDSIKYCEKVLFLIAKEYNIVSGLFYLKNPSDNIFRTISSYAFPFIEQPIEFTEGDGMSGQVAKNKKPIVLGNLNNQYFSTFSGLGTGLPKHLAILPILNHQNECVGIIELAAFKQFEPDFEQISEEISKAFIEYLSIQNV